MNNLLATLAATFAVLGGTTAAVLDSIPVLTDALTGAGAAALVGGLLSYRLERRAAGRGQPPALEPRWLVVRWSVVGAVVGVGVHLIAAVF
jgi:hypothetical protein